MKNIYKIVCLLVVSALFACDMDYPDYSAKRKEQFWKDQADAESALFACYGGLVNWSFFDAATWGLAEIASGNTRKGSSATDQTIISDYERFTYTQAHLMIARNWSSRYEVINFCNQVVTNVPGIKMDSIVKNQILGEAKFIRAYLYFDLVKTYGEVPLFDGLPADKNYNIPKSSIAEVYKLIKSDLEYAGLHCRKTAWDTNWKGRVTSMTAKAFLAKVKMYEASGENFMEDAKAINGTTWADVKAVTDEVISSGFYKLYVHTADTDSSFFHLFRLANENCDESIFEAQCGTSKLSAEISRSSWAQYQWANNLNGWGFNAPSDELISEWEKRTDDQIRYKQSVAYQGLVLPDGDVIGKMEQAGTSALGKDGATGLQRSRFNFKAYESVKDDKMNHGWQRLVEQNWRIYRYAEVLLIDAEAEFRLGNIAEALKSVNEVRTRVKQTPWTAADITLDKILDERRFELAFENDYFFDLVRSGRAANKLGTKGFKKKHTVFPIPQEEIDKSGGVLKQNKNWE